MRQLLVLLTLSAATLPAGAQDTDTTAQAETWKVDFGAEVGLLGAENSDGDKENYFSTVLLPVFTKGPWQIGGRVKLRLNQGGVRKADYDDFADILSMARYVQYSDKPATEEPGLDRYGRFGELESVRLGYGQLIGEYRNTVSVDHPQIGIEGSLGAENTLIEGMFSSITKPGIYGVRGAWWPFLENTNSRWQRALFGATLAGDLSTDGRLVNREDPGAAYVQEPFSHPTAEPSRGDDDGVLTMIAVDAGMPILWDKVDYMLGYVELTKVLGFGSGLSIGLNGTKKQNDVQMEGWFEQRLIGKQYLPNYFNSLYEIERVQGASFDLPDGTEVLASNSKRNLLLGQDDVLFGSFMAFEASVRRKYRVRTSYDRIWNLGEKDWFHIDIKLNDPTLPYEVRFMFDRIKMDGIEDIWNGPSENGILRLDLAYAFWEKLLLGFRFRQSFEPVEREGKLVGQDKRTRIEPNIVIRL